MRVIMIKGLVIELVQVIGKVVVVSKISKELADVLYNNGYKVVIR